MILKLVNITELYRIPILLHGLSDSASISTMFVHYILHTRLFTIVFGFRRIYTDSRLPLYPGSGQQVCVVVVGGGGWWVGGV